LGKKTMHMSKDSSHLIVDRPLIRLKDQKQLVSFIGLLANLFVVC